MGEHEEAGAIGLPRDMLILADSDHAIVEVNEGAVRNLGYSRAELLRMNVRDLRDPHTAGDFDARVRAQLQYGQGLFNTRYRRKDGTTFPVEVNVKVLQVDGKVYYQKVIRDVSGLGRSDEAVRLSEERLRLALEATSEADRRKERFLAVLSHELRNPLAVARYASFVLAHAPAAGAQA